MRQAALGALTFTRSDVEAVPDDRSECALLYTSGTTGEPKGCMLPNEYFLRAGDWYAKLGGLCRLQSGRERLITPLPMTHMNAMACLDHGDAADGRVRHPARSLSSATAGGIACASRARPSIHYLGVMPAMLLGAPSAGRRRDHAVRFGFGAGVESAHHAAFEERFGFPLIEAWAMTETGAGAVIIANREPRKVGTACFGAPDPSGRVSHRRRRRAGRARRAARRAAGARRRRGSALRVLREIFEGRRRHRGGLGGRLVSHRRRRVRATPTATFYFVDRKKNIIRRSGENISAVEVEGVLLQHPAVAGVGVAAVPDEVRGEEVMACVVPREPRGADRARAGAEHRRTLRCSSSRTTRRRATSPSSTQLPLTATAEDSARRSCASWRAEPSAQTRHASICGRLKNDGTPMSTVSRASLRRRGRRRAGHDAVRALLDHGAHWLLGPRARGY